MDGVGDGTHARAGSRPNAELVETLARRVAEQAVLYRFTDRLHRAGSLEEVYDAAITAIMDALQCDRASLLQFDEKDFMGFVASRGLSAGYRAAVNGHTPWGPADTDAQPISVGDISASDLDDHLKEVVLGEGIRAFAFIPLVGGERLIGKFMVYYDRPHDFTEDEINLAMTVARQIAFGIERRRADEERDRAEAALRDADRRKDEFLATLAHELRNPLAPMHGALTLLEARIAAGEDPSRLLDILSRQTTRLVRLVDDLMDVSRITRGYVELRREPTDIVAIVRAVLEATGDELAHASELSFETRLPADGIWVDGDPVRLEQIVHNLVSNAVKYTPAGGRVTVEVTRDGSDAAVRVADTGIGIDPELLGAVFDLFRQVDRTLDRSQGGLGIGLTVTKQLVELHGGRVEARSGGVGAGSEFTVRFPVIDAPPRSTSTTPPSDDHAAVRRRRVLVVDDNRDQTDVLAEMIEELGHEVHVAYDSASAVSLVGELRPDLVMLDIGLPGMSGYEVVAALRAEPANAGIGFVAVTGYSQPADREQSRRAGFDAHIVKPIPSDVLLELLENGRVA